MISNTDTKYIATLAEAAVKTDLLSKGYHVATPEGDYLPFDLLCITPDLNIYKVQVKTRKIKDGCVIIDLTRQKYKYGAKNNGYQTYSRKDVDVFAIFVRNLNKCFYVHSEILEDHVRALQLRITKTKNNQNKGIKMAKDYAKFPLL